MKTNIVSVTVAGSSQGTSTQLTTNDGWSIFKVTGGSVGGNGVVLPTDAEIGDIVEIHVISGSCIVYPESGGEINASGANTGIEMAHAFIRRTASGEWHGLYS